MHPVNYGIVVPFTAEWNRATAAASQVKRALRLQPLSDYRKAGDIGIFMKGAGSVADANFISAYWLAVAARLTRNRTLARAAMHRQAYAQARAGMPGSTTIFRGDAADIQEPLRSAAAQIQRTVGTQAATDPNLRAVLAALGAQQASTAVSRQAAVDQSIVTQARGTTTRSVADGAGMLDWARALMPGLTPVVPKPAWQVWALRGVALAGGMGVLAIVFRPYLKAGQAAARGVRAESQAWRESMTKKPGGTP